MAALGEPCYWVSDRLGAIQQDSAASRLEMQPRNIGSEFVGNRLRKLADAAAVVQAASGTSPPLSRRPFIEACGCSSARPPCRASPPLNGRPFIEA